MKRSIIRKIEDLLSAMMKGTLNNEIKDIVGRTTLENKASSNKHEFKVKLIQYIH